MPHPNSSQVAEPSVTVGSKWVDAQDFLQTVLLITNSPLTPKLVCYQSSGGMIDSVLLSDFHAYLKSAPAPVIAGAEAAVDNARATMAAEHGKPVLVPMPPPVIPGTFWVHLNGNLYEVYELTNVASDRPEKYPVMVSYRGANGFTWSRKLSDWHRSMMLIPPSTALLLTSTCRFSAALKTKSASLQNDKLSGS